MTFIKKSALILLFSSCSVFAAESTKKKWYTYPNNVREHYVKDDIYLPAFHLPQAQHKVRWEIYTGNNGTEIPGYIIPTYDLREDGVRLVSRKEGLNKNLEVWIENVTIRSRILFYRVTDKTNVEKVSDDGTATFRSGADLFWVSGYNVRRKK